MNQTADEVCDLKVNPRLTSRDRRSRIWVRKGSGLSQECATQIEKVTSVGQGVRRTGVAAGVGVPSVCWSRKMVGVCVGDVRCALGGW